MSEWLDSCFDHDDESAPVRAFIFGGTLSSIAAATSALAVDPTDWRLLLWMVGAFAFFGGGCGAMFALPPEKFARLCSFSFDLFGFLPLKLFLGIGIFPFVLIGFSLFVAILAGISAILALWRCGRSLTSWIIVSRRQPRDGRNAAARWS